MSEENDDRLKSIVNKYLTLAEWIYHDWRLNCDGQADERTLQRLTLVIAQHGPEGMFGVAAGWCTMAYWRVQGAYRRAGKTEVPPITPSKLPLAKLDNEEQTEFRDRAVTSAQQFLSFVTNDDLEMAEDIFKVAFDASTMDASGFMFAVLSLTTQISNRAKAIR